MPRWSSLRTTSARRPSAPAAATTTGMSPRTSARPCRSGTDPTTSIASTRRSLSAPIARPSILGPEAGRAGLTALMSSVLRPSSSNTSPRLLDHVDQQRVPEIGDQNADGFGPRVGQRPRRQVHPVPELVGGLLDPTALVLTHHRLTAHHQRDQRLRHPGPLGNITDRGPTAVRLAVCRHLWTSPGAAARFGPVQYDTSHTAASRCCFNVNTAEGRRRTPKDRPGRSLRFA